MKNLYQTWATGGSGYAVLQDKLMVHNRIFNSDSVIEDSSIYEWIDLGLPSGLLWASTNVGAENPEDFGLYFAWGETLGYTGITDTKQFSLSDYKWCNGSEKTLTKYNYNKYHGIVDNLFTLEQIDDVVYISDNTCRMPTKADFEELLANTTRTWETLNSVEGTRFTSKTNSNSIFVPAAGICNDGSVDNVGSYCYLWSSSLHETYSSDSWLLNLFSVNMIVSFCDRYYGLTIRPVKENN